MKIQKAPLNLAFIGKVLVVFGLLFSGTTAFSLQPEGELVVIDTPPIAPQSYDRYGGEVIEPFALDRKTKAMKKKKFIQAQKNRKFKRSKVRKVVRRKASVARNLASRLPAKKVKKKLNKRARQR